MSDYKFKVGDRVRCVPVKQSCADHVVGDEFTILERGCNYRGTAKSWSDQNWYSSVKSGDGNTSYEDGIELVTKHHTPITPKVGDRFRVVKVNKYSGVSPREVGHEFTVKRVGDNMFYGCPVSSKANHDYQHTWFTTEYLEPVEEENPNLPIATAEIEEGQESFDLPKGHAGGTVMFEMKSTLDNIRTWKENNYIDEPIKQPITKTIMNIYRKARMSADDRKLYKANYINEDGTPTREGKEANDFINWDSNKKALVEMAEADIKEVEDAK